MINTRRGATLLEVIIMITLTTTLAVAVVFAQMQSDKSTHRIQLMSSMGNAGWMIQQDIAPALASAKITGVSVNYKANATTDNMKVEWKNRDETVTYTVELWQSRSLLWGKWTTAPATGTPTVSERVLAHDLMESGGVSFAAGPRTGEIVLTLKWLDEKDQTAARAWTLATAD